MTDTAIPSSEILELIRGQARLETKIDTFLGAQNAMKSEIDAIKADVAEIKSQRRATAATVAAFSTAACIFWIVVGEKVKKIFGF